MFYCEKFIQKGRKTKMCSSCGKNINIGESSYSIPSENFETNITLCLDCHKKYEDMNITNISEIELIDF